MAMFSLAKLAVHHHPLDEPMKDIRWTSYEPSHPPGLLLKVESGFMKITKPTKNYSIVNCPVLTKPFGSVRLVRHLGNPRIKTESDFLPFIGGLSYQAIAVQGNSEGEGMSLASDSKFCRTVNA